MGLKLSGSLNLTGSLKVSGSTIQVGNNTLIGNTVLSGSLTISGSQPGTATNVNIYGDTSINGAIKFLPILEAIDTSVSASYIFVSGSTQDLYFSQNGSGFNNVTRLKWLEGNLYTGILGGGVVSQIDSTNYKIAKGSGIIVNLNATTASIEPYPIIKYIQWNDLSSSINSLSASYDQQFIGVDTNSQIVKQGTPFVNGQFDSLINIGLVLHQNNSTINAVKTQPNLSYGLGQRVGVFTRAFGPLKIGGFILSGSGTQGIQVSSGTGFLQGAAYTYDPNNPDYVVDGGTSTSKIYRYHNTSSFTENFYNTNGGVGYTVLDPTQYSNNGTLTTVSGTNANNSQWTIQRVYWFPNSVAKAFIVYYGNAQYTTEALALDGLQEERFIEAPNTTANAIYLGALLLRKDFTWADSTTYRLVPGGLFRSVSSGGSATGFGTIATDISSLNSKTGSYATTGSNTFIGTETISGSILLSGSLTINQSRIDNGWTAYTPEWTAASVNPVINNGTIEGYYKVIGKTCFVRGNIAMGSTTTFGTGEWYVSMPFTASHADGILMTATLLDNSTAWYNAILNGARAGFSHKSAIQYQVVGGTADSLTPTAPFTWASGDRFTWNGSYEIA